MSQIRGSCLSIAVLKVFREMRQNKVSHWRDEVLCLTDKSCKDGRRGLSYPSGLVPLVQSATPASFLCLPPWFSFLPMCRRPVSCSLFQTILIFQILSPKLIVLVLSCCLVVQLRDLSHWLP